jgi:hypothetical protein
MTATGTDRKVARDKTRGVFLGLCVAGLLLSAPPAKANTYLFSFTGQQALDALEASVGGSEHSQSGYYQLFVQPLAAQISGYTYASYSGPTPNATDAWETQTITDPSAPELGYIFPCGADCTWVRFGKGYTQDPVAVLTEATFSFIGAEWGDNAPAPYGWGPTVSSVESLVSPASTFQFTINTNQVLNGTYSIKGYASALVSGSPTSFSGIIKDTVGIAFTLQATAVDTVPEPGTSLLLFTALSLVAFFHVRNRKRTPGPSQATRNTASSHDAL